MLYPIANVEDLQKLNELVSLQYQVKETRLQYKLDEHKYYYDVKNLQEPLIDTIKNTSGNITKFISETSIKNKKENSDSNEEVPELMNEKRMIAPYLASSLVILFKPKNKSQFRLLKDLNSTEMNDFLIKGGIPVTLYNNMLTFGDSNKPFRLDVDLLKTKTITIYIINVDHSNQQDRKLNFEFGKEMKFDIKQKGRKSDRDKTLKRLLKPPTIMASGTSTKFLTSDPTELCNKYKKLLQEKQAAINSNIIDEELVALVEKLLENKCKSKKEFKQILLKCNLLHTFFIT